MELRVSCNPYVVNAPEFWASGLDKSGVLQLRMHHVLACEDCPCLNGASCGVTDTNMFQCNCPAFYYGVPFCQYSVCTDNPCENNGTCHVASSVNTGYQCSCPSGFSGPRCEEVLCTADPCDNGGTCVQNGTSFFCECPAGYSGSLCAHSVCDSNPCLNKGSCVVNPDYKPPNKQTQRKRDDSNVPFTCNCRTGYSGKTCEYDPCHPQQNLQCLNGGKCKVNDISEEGYVCSCTAFHTGEQCQYEQVAFAYEQMYDDVIKTKTDLSNFIVAQRSALASALVVKPIDVVDLVVTKSAIGTLQVSCALPETASALLQDLVQNDQLGANLDGFEQLSTTPGSFCELCSSSSTTAPKDNSNSFPWIYIYVAAAVAAVAILVIIVVIVQKRRGRNSAHYIKLNSLLETNDDLGGDEDMDNLF
eukprot:m.181779 g.181779  ORF g.181779 m.181779 type:complete len:417 (-) comp25462_c4_seq12:169-1419(-)